MLNSSKYDKMMKSIGCWKEDESAVKCAVYWCSEHEKIEAEPIDKQNENVIID